jgi:hypothetical protein
MKRHHLAINPDSDIIVPHLLEGAKLPLPRNIAGNRNAGKALQPAQRHERPRT